MKQMDRRLLILMRLREERPIRAADLAEVCECSVRTIYRDIDALCEAGVPVAAMPGEGYRLVEGYHLPQIAFTAEEAVQLLLGSDIALGLGTVSQREATLSAAAKVEAALRPETREEVDRLRERIRVSRCSQHETTPWLPLLQQAVINDRVLELRYHSFGSDELTQRQVEPHYLVHYGNDWHLVAYCRLRKEMRDFRAGRIREAELLDECFERIADVDLQSTYQEREHREVRVWLEASAVPWAREAPAYGLRAEEPCEGGSVFVYDTPDVRRLMPWLLSWGASARVLSPEDVVDRVRKEAQALVEAYGDA